MRPYRRRAVDGLTGEVLEIGFGSGHNIGLYPTSVTGVRAVEPSAVAWKLTAKRRATASVPIEQIGLTGEQIPLDDECCDSALSTFTLCTIPDVAAALAEVHRVLRPGGTFHFVEHGLSPDPAVQRRQRRFEPVQRRLFDGCHLTREPAELVRAAGFELGSVEAEYAQGPKPLAWFTIGTATKPG